MTTGVIFRGGGLLGQWETAQWAQHPQSLRVPPFLGGESIGACVALVTAVRGAVESRALFSKIGPEDIFTGGNRWDQLMVLLGRRHGIWDMSPAYRTLQGIIGNRRIPEGIRVMISRVNLRHGVYLVDTLTSDTPPAAAVEIAYQSCLVPVAHGARDGIWADGGIGGTAPPGPMVSAGVDNLIVYLTNPAGLEPWNPTGKAVDEAGRAVDILRDRLWHADLENIVLRNELAGTGWSSRWHKVTGEFREPAGYLGEWMSATPAEKRLRETVGNRLWTSPEKMLAVAKARRAAAEMAARSEPVAAR